MASTIRFRNAGVWNGTEQTSSHISHRLLRCSALNIFSMKRLPGGDGRRGLSGAARREPGALFRLRSAHALFRRHQPPAPCGAVDDYPAATRHFVGQVLRAFRAVLVRPHPPPAWLRLHGQRLHKGQNWRAQFGSGSGRRGNNPLQDMRGFSLASVAERNRQRQGNGLPCQRQEQISGLENGFCARFTRTSCY